MINDFGYSLDSATCGELTRLENLGFSGENAKEQAESKYNEITAQGE